MLRSFLSVDHNFVYFYLLLPSVLYEMTDVGRFHGHNSAYGFILQIRQKWKYWYHTYAFLFGQTIDSTENLLGFFSNG